MPKDSTPSTSNRFINTANSKPKIATPSIATPSKKSANKRSSKPTIGLTGGIGSGKSTVAIFFEELGIQWVDMDHIAREVVEPNQPAYNAIIEHFSNNIPQLCLPDKTLNRTALRQHIFQNLEDKQWLEALLHPLIRQSTSEQLQAFTSPYGLLVSPLLFENDIPVDAAVVVDSTEAQQVARGSTRDNQSEESIKAIMRAQLSRQERLAKADYIIHNNGDLDATKQQVQSLHSQLFERYKTNNVTK